MLKQLPQDINLPINLLAACFNKTSATYKYYWLLSVVQEVECGNLQMPKKSIFSRMISNAWYTVNYFHVSFGKQDLIQDAIIKISTLSKISVDEKKEIVYQKLLNSEILEINSILWHFNKQVPHWFLTPWFLKIGEEKDSVREKRIYDESQSFNNQCPYALYANRIVINPDWVDYLTINAKMLKDFCLWNLALFLQSKNPNVPDIPNKIFKTELRKPLTNQRKNFWDIVIKENGPVTCIYTGKLLDINEYAVEHYIPHSFVSHDLIWNLIPADKSFNSTKSDKLPPMKYFDAFYNLQDVAVQIIKSTHPKSKFLEDYLTIFPDYEASFSKDKFRETIQPLITIASNNGFEFLP
jgi:HNH endonuclease